MPALTYARNTHIFAHTASFFETSLLAWVYALIAPAPFHFSRASAIPSQTRARIHARFHPNRARRTCARKGINAPAKCARKSRPSPPDAPKRPPARLNRACATNPHAHLNAREIPHALKTRSYACAKTPETPLTRPRATKSCMRENASTREREIRPKRPRTQARNFPQLALARLTSVAHARNSTKPAHSRARFPPNCAYTRARNVIIFPHAEFFSHRLALARFTFIAPARPCATRPRDRATARATRPREAAFAHTRARGSPGPTFSRVTGTVFGGQLSTR
jgi:hypothetical protein